MQIHNRLIISASLLAVAVLPAASQTFQPADRLPNDTAVHRGQLPNGLRYLIRRNTQPRNRAELRLVVNAGSILETEEQRGVAHFVEHMAFNGTARFPKGDIVNFLERNGMRFGADLNASTSFDETIYTLTVPTDTARILNSALDVLEDWAHSITFDSTEASKERGVVLEERRTGLSAERRVQDKQFPVMLKGSLYADRLPIGTLENLERFPISVAKQFYADWYRPDLMTVVAVGDFDLAQMEANIRERFSRIPPATSPKPRTLARVPDHAETLVSVEADKEYPSSQVLLMWLRQKDSVRTVADFRRSLVAQLYDGMVNTRLNEISRQPTAPFSYAGAGRGSFVRTKDVYQMAAGVKGNAFIEAEDALLSEAERIAQFGFTQTELDRLRTNYLRSLEQAYAERSKTSSAVYANQLVGAALGGGAVLSIEQRQALTQQLLPAIALNDVNALARSTMSDRNRVVLVAAPDRTDVTLPTSKAILDQFDRVKSEKLAAYVDSTSDAPLLPQLPTPGRVVSEATLPETGILEWKLSNGARVLLKPTDFKNDEVLFGGFKPGGISLLPIGDVKTAELSNLVVSVGGLGTFNQTTLGKKLTGKRAGVGTSLGEYGELLRGSASSKDIETMFQLAYLRMTAPRIDSLAFAALKSQVRSELANSRNSPESVFQDTVSVTMAQHNSRVWLASPTMLDSVDIKRALGIIKDRFADASGFTFYLVGSFSPDSVKPLIERYIASLPSLNRVEKARDPGIRPPSGVVERTVRKGVEAKAQTLLVFNSPCAYSYPNRIVMSALRELLDIRLRESLREDKSGTYGVGVSAACHSNPYEHAEVTISFGSSPERREELVASVFAVIDSIKAGVISDSNVAKIREITIRANETSLRQNNSWIGAMMDADEDGRDQRDFLRVPALITAVTKEQIQAAAKAYLNREQYARFTLLPENAGQNVP